MSRVERIQALVDEALAAGLGSAAALSIGDAWSRGRPPRAGPLPPAARSGAGRSTTHAWFDVASLTKPMATVAMRDGAGR